MPDGAFDIGFSHWQGLWGGSGLRASSVAVGGHDGGGGFMSTMSPGGLDLPHEDFAIAYADQNEQDYRRLLEAISAGRVLATVEQH
jgi:hypothetical protein